MADFNRVSRTFDELLTFTRASEATFFDSDGVLQTAAVDEQRLTHDPVTGEALGLLIEEQRTNLLQYPRSFNPNYWTGAYIARPAGAVSPNGRLDAYKVVADTADALHGTNGSFTATVGQKYVLAVVAKAAEFSKVRLQFIEVTNALSARADVDLSDGTVDTVKNDIESYGSELLPDGYVRAWIVKEANDTDMQCVVYLIDGAGNVEYPGDGTSGIYLWHAQLEEGSFPTSVIPDGTTFTSRASTATYLDSAGTLQTAAVDEARADAYGYDENGVLRPIGLLLEGASTNLLTYSEAFENGAWDKNGVSVLVNADTAPDGSLTARRIVEDTSLGGHLVTASVDLVAGNTYTLAVYCKSPGAGRHVRLQYSTGTFGAVTRGYFDLESETVTVADNCVARIARASGGFYRIQITAEAQVTETSGFNAIGMGDTTDNASYQGDGETYLTVWGAQLEEGNYPTSYIPTAGSQVTRSADASSSPQVTREADSCSRTLGAEFNPSEGTLFANFVVDGVVPFQRVFSINDGSFNNAIRFQVNSGGRWIARIDAGQPGAIATVPGLVTKGRYKLALSYTSETLLFAVNGVSAEPASVTNLPTGLTTHNPASNGLALSISTGAQAVQKYFPRALTQAELEDLTA